MMTPEIAPIPATDNAPVIVRQMTEAARKAGVGPMAAAAGAIAESVGQELLAFSPEIIVENGGDITGGIEFAKNIEGLQGMVIIKDDNAGLWGEVKICRISG